jgi:hypothetical protein
VSTENGEILLSLLGAGIVNSVSALMSCNRVVAVAEGINMNCECSLWFYQESDLDAAELGMRDVIAHPVGK